MEERRTEGRIEEDNPEVGSLGGNLEEGIQEEDTRPWDIPVDNLGQGVLRLVVPADCNNS